MAAFLRYKSPVCRLSDSAQLSLIFFICGRYLNVSTHWTRRE